MEERFVTSNGMVLFVESFGHPKDSTVFLIQGNGAQGMLWRSHFCSRLAQQGYFVLRYDHRDTGLSTKIKSFKDSPYHLKDMMQDSIGILDALNCEKAHIVGSSMGGYIAQLLAHHFPERVTTLTLMMTSPFALCLDHAFSENLPLPFLTESFRDFLLTLPPFPKTLVEKARYLQNIWNAYNGQGLAYDISTYEQMAQEWVQKDSDMVTPIHHSFAVANSEFDRRAYLKNILHKTLIIHGEKDPYFPTDHAQKLHHLIPLSSLVIIKHLGHLLHGAFDEPVLNALIPHLQTNSI